MRIKLAPITAFLAASLLLAGCATSPTGRTQFMVISPGQAIAESQKAYVATVGGFSESDKLASDPEVIGRIREVTGRVVTVAQRQFPSTADWAWSVAVVDDPNTVNAWCMAGGRMAVYTGLLQQLELTDDELAHIMGHEAAHAIANHSAEQMSYALASNLTLAGVQIFTEVDEAGLQGAAMAAQVALQLPNSRTAESEADEIGAEIAIRAGYDPEAALTLWQKMGALGGERPPEFLSTHPSPENRQARLSELVGAFRRFAPSSPDEVPVHPVEMITARR